MDIRIGHGYDVHRLVSNRKLILGGIEIEHPLGLSGHSDADVVLHALVDALLGALGLGDIGDFFPPSEAEWKNMSSSHFVKETLTYVAQHNFRVNNVDITIVCEEPKLYKYKSLMKASISALLEISPSLVNIKATTNERMGFVGRHEGIAAFCVASLKSLV